MSQNIITKITKWTFEEKEGKWYGTCLECKGEKAKYTPETLKDKGIKPCSICTNLETYNSHSPNKEKS